MNEPSTIPYILSKEYGKKLGDVFEFLIDKKHKIHYPQTLDTWAMFSQFVNFEFSNDL
jgi:hypothetical protein